MEGNYNPMEQVMQMMQMLNQRKQLRQADRGLDQHQQQLDQMYQRYGQEQELGKNQALLHALTNFMPQAQMIPDADKAAYFEFLRQNYGLPEDFGQQPMTPDMQKLHQRQGLYPN